MRKSLTLPALAALHRRGQDEQCHESVQTAEGIKHSVGLFDVLTLLDVKTSLNVSMCSILANVFFHIAVLEPSVLYFVRVFIVCNSNISKACHCVVLLVFRSSFVEKCSVAVNCPIRSGAAVVKFNKTQSGYNEPITARRSCFCQCISESPCQLLAVLEEVGLNDPHTSSACVTSHSH